MNLAAPLNEEERTNVPALVLAALVHLALIGALFFGVQWKSKEAASVAVELWSAPPPSAVRPPPVVEPKHESKPEAKPEPKPEVKPEPEPKVKPDIAVKDEKKPKKEEPKKPEPKKEEPKKEEPKKPEPKKEEPKKVEPKKEEAKKPEPDRRPDFSDEISKELKDSQKKSNAREQNARINAELNQLGQLKGDLAAAGRARGLADYVSKVAGKIRGNIVLPPGIQGNPEAIFVATQLPSGDVISVKIRKSSGSKALDEAIERAILKSSPLPKPDQPELFDRELKIPYKPYAE